MVLKVLVADDHPVYRAGLRALLASIPQIDVVGEAATGAQAAQAAVQGHPDVVIMDLHISRPRGIEATRRIATSCPTTGVLVLVTAEDVEGVFAAMRAGARGFLFKAADQPELVRAIEAVAHGEAIFCPVIADRLLERVATWNGTSPHKPFPELTDREREVLGLIAKGESNSAIARSLVVSPKTVRNHISNIFTKLHVPDRAKAIVAAREAGLGHHDDSG